MSETSGQEAELNGEHCDYSETVVAGTPQDPEFRLAKEIVPIDGTDRRDVFVAGYPKSGNTWCQSCVAAMMYGLDVTRTPDAVIQSLVPDIHVRTHFIRFQTPMVFKTHRTPRPRYRRVIHLLRDGRDAMSSYYHYARNLWGEEDNDWESIMRRGAIGNIKWHEHTQAWLDNPYKARILTVRYEDMKRKTVPTLGEIAAFLGLQLTKRQLRYVAKVTTFSRMQDREARLGWTCEFPKDKRFVRRGTVGNHKDEMPPEILRAFEQESEEALRATGYWNERKTVFGFSGKRAA